MKIEKKLMKTINFDNAQRYNPDVHTGLTASQVAERIENKYINFDATVQTKSITKILISNLATIFNLINIVIAIALIYVGAYKDVTFMGVIIANVTIGIVQEIRAKKATEKLSFLSQSKVNVIRDGKEFYIDAEDIVLDEIIKFKMGSQIITDCILLEGECEVNESFVTGESETVNKNAGDVLLSGSFISSGSCVARADKIANKTYISSISNNARAIKAPRSILMKSLKTLMTIISIAIFPIGILLFLEHFDASNSNLMETVQRTSAALIGMIPQGLMLLTSTALAVSVVRLSKKKVLVADLYCIEMLARVDTICLDKTGTLTEGKMTVEKIVPLKEEFNFNEYLSAFSKQFNNENATIEAINEKFNAPNSLEVTKKIAFSSKTKWSGAVFSNGKGIIIGAAEYILPHNEYVLSEARKYSNDYRVILIAETGNDMEYGKLPQEIQPVGFILLCDKIRSEAFGFIKYLKEQEVNIKVVSGDNPITVSEISKQVGIENYDKYIDCSTITDEKELAKAAISYTIFGRVSPFQKKIIVKALQKKKHIVAMTGDGVNDVLAMKEADCSVAMGSGTDAARNVSKIVLLESNFDSLPSVIAEGRRSVNNIQRAASLFLVKTFYSFGLSLTMIIFHFQFPFQPIQQSFISLIAIGIPSFVLAMQNNKKRIQNGFVKNVLLTCLPGAVTISLAIVAILVLQEPLGLSERAVSTMAVISTGVFALCMQLVICQKPNKIEKILIFATSAMFIFGSILFSPLLELVQLNGTSILILILIIMSGMLVMLNLAKFSYNIIIGKNKDYYGGDNQ
ncbi:HAD-IC family P-type ATPase [Eubacteriales bacterium OttesenSCG-928-G02]|nr:HAD-IC family P-type ATPase [Eubacteriales bacterium OttesenSCG-928-G02]